MAARFETVDGITHMPNLPTEEVFTSPDPARTDGHVTSSKPLVLRRRNRRQGPEGHASSTAARSSWRQSTAQETMRTIVARDEGAARLGEVALVDREGRIGALTRSSTTR